MRFQNLSLLRYRSGTFQNVSPDLSSVEKGVTAMCRGNGGEVLFVTRSKGLLRSSGEGLTPFDSTTSQPTFLVISIAETADGKVWIGSRDGGLFSLSGGLVSSVAPGSPDRKINCLLPVGPKELWIGMDNGVVRWNGTEITRTGLPRSLEHVQTLAMTKDREANIWIGTASGLLRINALGVSSLEKRGGEAVTALYEDREGNLWVGGARGIERFRDSVFMTYSASRGLGSEINGPLYADAENRAWFAPADGGLFWLKEAHIERATIAGLGKDVVYSIAGGKGELWVGRQRGGLTRLRHKGGSFSAETFTQAEGLAQNSVYAVYQSRDGTVWAGTLSGGVSSFKNGKFTTYTTANGLASNTVTAILESSDGTMWFATPNGLNTLSQGRWRVYTGRDGLPPGSVNCLLEDSTGAMWVGTSEGLAFLNSGQIKLPREVPGSLHEPIFGVAEDRNGWLWIATSNHVMRVNRDKLLRGSLGAGDAREYGPADGLASAEGVKRTRITQEIHDTLLQSFLSASMQLHVAVEQVSEDSPAKPRLNHVQQLMGQIIDESRNTIRGMRSSGNDSLDLGRAFDLIRQEFIAQKQIDFRVVVEGRPRLLHPIIRDEVYSICREAVVNAFRHAGANSIEVELEYAARRLRVLVRDDCRGIGAQTPRSGSGGRSGLVGMRERAEGIGARLKVRPRAAAGTEVELSVPSRVAYLNQPPMRPQKWLASLSPIRAIAQFRKSEPEEDR